MTRDTNTIYISDQMEQEDLWYFKSFYEDRKCCMSIIEILKEYIDKNHFENGLAIFVNTKTDWTFIARRLIMNYL